MADNDSPSGAPAVTAAPQTPPAAGSEPATPSHRDWNQMAQNMRALNEGFSRFQSTLDQTLQKLLAPQGAPQQNAAPAKTENAQSGPVDTGMGDRLAKLERELAVSRAVANHGLSGDARKDFEELAATVGLEHIETLATKLAKYKPQPTSAAPATPPAASAPAVAAGTTNTGPAAPGAAPIIPDEVTKIDKDVWASLSPSEKRARYEAQKRARGNHGNVFAAIRESLKK